VQYLNSFPNSYCYQEIASPVLDLFFTARAVYPSAIVPEDSEVSAWMWSDINQNILDNMAFHSNRLALEFYLNRKVD
jgi:ADP-ribose pyrophosphatase